MAEIGWLNNSNTQGQSQLMNLLTVDEIVPGSDPSYQVCKTLYAYHPLGMKMVDAPLHMAQSLPRVITIPDAPAEDLLKAFWAEWYKLGKIGADRLIHNAAKTARIYGISSLVVGTRGVDPSKPIDFWNVKWDDLYFNVLDPLNTSGSLVLDQDPNSPDYQKPTGVRAGSQVYHPSRAVVMMNEEPLYIEWTNSAFGFVGRSVYQRALFPLKSYIQSMITDDVVTQKCALLVAKLKSPSSIIDKLTQGFFSDKRTQIKQAATGNVLQLGVDEDLVSLDLKNLRDAAEFARNNIMKNIATAANMPASMINQETLAEGFGEGSEDAKQIARYIDGVRMELQPLYDYFDNLVMHKAWGEEFFKSIQRKYPEWEKVEYKTAFLEWKNNFSPEWPNLLVEPDSKAVELEAKIMESAIGIAETVLPVCDPENKARVVGWLADLANERKKLVSSPLEIDVDALAEYEPPAPPPAEPKTQATYDI